MAGVRSLRLAPAFSLPVMSTAKLIVVTAIVPFTHDGVSVVTGDVLEVEPIIAASLTYRGLVRLGATVPRYQTAAITPDQPAEPQPRVKRRYKRRDMVPEQ